MGLRLSLDDERDKEFLSKRINKQTGRTLLDEALEARLKARPQVHQSENANVTDIGIDKSKIESTNKRQKYGNRIFKKDGYTWRSEFEYQVWLILKDYQKKKVIYDLRIQIEYKFEYNNVYIARYIADFVFFISKNNLEVIADAKHRQTAKQLKFVWQKKMMLAFYEKPITCIFSGETDIQKLLVDLSA